MAYELLWASKTRANLSKKNFREKCDSPCVRLAICYLVGMQDTYETNWQKYIKGEITEQEWRAFCDAVLDEILVENQDMMMRLKFV